MRTCAGGPLHNTDPSHLTPMPRCWGCGVGGLEATEAACAQCLALVTGPVIGELAGDH